MAQETASAGNPNSTTSRKDKRIADNLDNLRSTANQYYGVGVESAKRLKDSAQQHAKVFYDQALIHGQKYPLLAAFLGIWVFLSAFPITIFVIFTILSTLVTLGWCIVAIVVIQGFVISIAGAVLLGILASLFLFSCFLFCWGLILWGGFNGVNKAWDWYEHRAKATIVKTEVKEEKY